MAYLERIDATRWYSNFGPLVRAFEARLAEVAELRMHHMRASVDLRYAKITHETKKLRQEVRRVHQRQASPRRFSSDRINCVAGCADHRLATPKRRVEIGAPVGR